MAENECMVSVLCTAYNHEEYIAQALESFLSQETGFPFEIIVNDDASPDGTADIIRQIAADYPGKVIAFYQEKNLYSQGINIEDTVMLPAARGKYIAFCEGDDYWSDMTKLQRQVDFMEAHPEYSACVHDTVIHYCDGSAPDSLHSKKYMPQSGDRDIDFADILKGMAHAYHTSSLLFRREFAFDLPDYFYCGAHYGFADFPRALFLSLSGPIRFLDRPMSVYRARSNPTSWSSNVDGQYDKLRRFVYGQTQMLSMLLPHVPEEHLPAARQALTEREFELMYIEGRDREQRQGVYRELLRAKPLSYRAKNFLKSYFPAVQHYYRKRRGFGDDK